MRELLFETSLCMYGCLLFIFVVKSLHKIFEKVHVVLTTQTPSRWRGVSCVCRVGLASIARLRLLPVVPPQYSE